MKELRERNRANRGRQRRTKKMEASVLGHGTKGSGREQCLLVTSEALLEKVWEPLLSHLSTNSTFFGIY